MCIRDRRWSPRPYRPTARAGCNRRRQLQARHIGEPHDLAVVAHQASEGLEAATASFRVGYESPSHFSREYSRLFGAPPRADVIKLRGETPQAVRL